jgi:hypothetical protein
MSTPPPPLGPSVDPGAHSPQPGLSEAARIINTFIAPRKTFEDLRRNESWWVPWLIASIFTVLLAVVIVQKVDLRELVEKRAEQSKIAQSRMEQLSPAQREQAMGMQVTFSKVQYFIRPVFILLGGLLVALVLMATFNFGFAAEIPFQRSLAVVFYGWLPGTVVKTALVVVALLFGANASGIDPDMNPVATSAGFFMDRTANKFLWGLGTNLDVVSLWTVALVAIGFAAASNNKKISTGTALTTVFVLYAVVALCGSALGSVF